MELAGGKNFRITITLKDCRKKITPFLNLITVHFEESIIYNPVTFEHVKITPHTSCGNNGQTNDRIADKRTSL
jgi:hypothetical protein